MAKKKRTGSKKGKTEQSFKNLLSPTRIGNVELKNRIAGRAPELRGADGVFAVVEQLAGVRLPASAWETLVLPQRVRGYQPRDLDELTANGEVLVVGAGSAGAADPWVMLLPADYAAQLVDVPDGDDLAALGPLQQRILDVLADGGGGGFLFSLIAQHVGSGEGAAEGRSRRDAQHPSGDQGSRHDGSGGAVCRPLHLHVLQGEAAGWHHEARERGG